MVKEIALKCKNAGNTLRLSSSEIREKALIAMAGALMVNEKIILEANKKDIEASAGLSEAMIERLTLNHERLEGMREGLLAIAAAPDPIGSADYVTKRPNGLNIAQTRVPLGLIGIIYESRPNVTADTAGLCIKSGNTCLLRGGKEAIFSNKAITAALREGLNQVGLPENCICLVEDTSRESAKEMMGLSGILDLLIPRGGGALIRSVVENARVPVIHTGEGNCHIYIDDEADLEMAFNITVNAKCSRPSVCNALETLLISEKIAEKFLTGLKPMLDKYNVEIRGCSKAFDILSHGDLMKNLVSATEEDWALEYNDFILAVKIVQNLEEACTHISKYGTGHSEGIVTGNYFKAIKFTNLVDAACVYVNASTRFTDGGEFGLGAEVGISTQKLHARGPMGLNALTSTKFIVLGEGQIRK